MAKFHHVGRFKNMSYHAHITHINCLYDNWHYFLTVHHVFSPKILLFLGSPSKAIVVQIPTCKSDSAFVN